MANSNQDPDRIAKILEALNDPTIDELPDSLKYKYEDGWDEDKLEEELQNHPFFMTELPDPSKPLPPLLHGLQQLKYSEVENSNHELAEAHKEDGIYHFKLKKYRIASYCFTSALSYELKDPKPDPQFISQLYNNRSACMWFLKNYRSCINDCKLALKHTPDYLKAFKRCVQAMVEVERWAEVEEMCASWKGVDSDSFKFICEMRIKAKKGMVKVKTDQKRKEIQDKVLTENNKKLMECVKQRGIKLTDEDFLDSEAAGNGRVVTLEAVDGQEMLHWPVLFMYPQFNQSDFIEAFCEEEIFATHLTEMLNIDNAPSWDTEHEYTPDNVDLYYLCSKLVKVDPSSTLLEVMKNPLYKLPGNGVPCFFVLAKNNAFCEDFIERVEVA